MEDVRHKAKLPGLLSPFSSCVTRNICQVWWICTLASQSWSPWACWGWSWRWWWCCPPPGSRTRWTGLGPARWPHVCKWAGRVCMNCIAGSKVPNEQEWQEKAQTFPHPGVEAINSVMIVYIRVSVVLYQSPARKEREKLYIILDRHSFSFGC